MNEQKNETPVMSGETEPDVKTSLSGAGEETGNAAPLEKEEKVNLNQLEQIAAQQREEAAEVEEEKAAEKNKEESK